MNRPSSDLDDLRPASRLGALSPLDYGEWEALAEARLASRRVAARRSVLDEGDPVKSGWILLSGWACRTRIFADGRRQILSLLLPGDLIGVCRQRNPVASTGAIALTDVLLCPAPDPHHPGRGLSEAYARSGALDEYYLFRQIARLGRMSAYERIADLLLEIRERLSLVMVGVRNDFPLLMTQEAIGDLLGLTSVHVNRMLQSLRRDRLAEVNGRVARIIDADRLERVAGFQPAAIFRD